MSDIITVEDTPKRIIDLAQKARQAAMDKMCFHGTPPIIELHKDCIVAHDGVFSSCYNTGSHRIYVSWGAAANHYRGTGNASEIMTVYYVAHETAHYIQQQRGYLEHVPLMPSDNVEYYSYATEAEAHSVGNDVLYDFFGFRVLYDGEEQA